MFESIRRVVRQWTRPALPPRRQRTPRAQRKRPVYTGRDSGTRTRILQILSDGASRTREEISAQLDVTSAAIHLPRMVEDGLIVSAYDGRRKSYALAPTRDPFLGELSIYRNGQWLMGINDPFVQPALEAIKSVLPPEFFVSGEAFGEPEAEDPIDPAEASAPAQEDHA